MLVEGKTRYAVLLRNNDLKSKPLMNRRIHQISALPAEARRSMPFYRGLEFVARPRRVGNRHRVVLRPQAP